MSLYLIIMGVQGAGKGTQAAFIEETYGIPHISTGDLFRAMKSRDDELARRVQEIMNAGDLVSDEVTSEVLKDRLEQPDAANGAVLDGYPRNISQAKWLEDYLASRGESLTAVLLLDLDLYTAFKRSYGRVKSNATGETFNIYFNSENIVADFDADPQGKYPPRVVAKKRDTGEELSRRSDDEAASVVKRIDTFVETTQPLIDYYDERGLLMSIKADQPIEAVNEDIRTAIAQMKQQTS
jgi:adenylate kinase